MNIGERGTRSVILVWRTLSSHVRRRAPAGPPPSCGRRRRELVYSRWLYRLVGRELVYFL
jgi:hypothetical protein